MNDLKRIRALLGMSQAAFAAASGVPKRTIENWESGKSSPPDYVLRLLLYWVKNEYGIEYPFDTNADEI